MRVFFILLFNLCAIFVSAKKSYDGYQLVQVTPISESDVEYLKEIEGELDFWRPIIFNKPTEILLSSNKRDRDVFEHLKFEGFHPRVVIPDVGKLIAEQHQEHQQLKYRRIFHESYHDLEEINQWIDAMAENHPDIASKYLASTSYEGRDVWGLHIQAKPEDSNPYFWFDGGIHAREWVSPATVMYMAEQLLTSYGVDQQVTSMLDSMNFYVVPVINVDGYEWTWTDDRLWRKTRSENDGSLCLGTDPNRNWDVAWNTVGTSNLPCANTYAGSHAFSEIEVSTIDDFLKERSDIIAFFSYHSYGQMYMTPFGYKTDEAPDYEELMEICVEAVAEIFSVNGINYECDSLTNLVGPNSGGSVDYTYDILNIKYAYGIELRDTGEFGFTLPEEQILPTAEESYAGLLVFIEKILAAVN